MLHVPVAASPERKVFKVSFEKRLQEYHESDAIVIKSPAKRHDSPTKKRHTYSTIPLINTTTFVHHQVQHQKLPPIPPLAPFNFDSDSDDSSDSESLRKLAWKVPSDVAINHRHLYIATWIVCTGILMFLSLQSSVSTLSTQKYSEVDIMQKQLQHLVHQDEKLMNTQSRYDSKSIVSNIADETENSIEVASTASDSLTTKSNVDAVIEKDIQHQSGISTNVEPVKIDDNQIESKSAVMSDVEKKTLQSPYSMYERNTTHTPRFAYAYVISGCNEEAPHRNYLYDISISTYLQREAGSTADVIVFIQMAYKSKLNELEEKDRLLLDTMNIHIIYIPKTSDESFYRTMLDKFRILGLVQYERVLFMDGDVLARGNLDYLFDLSVRGILKRNIVTAGKSEPANGGFFMLSPSMDASDRIMTIIRDKEGRGKQIAYPHWDEDIGWGHKFEEGDFARLNNGRQFKQWNFYGAFADQGTEQIDSFRRRLISKVCIFSNCLSHYVYIGLLYHWVKYEEKSVSIIFKYGVENWDVDSQGNLFMEQRLELDIFNDYNVDRICWNIRPCKTPFKDYIHYTGKSKPWLISPPDGFQTDSISSSPHFWYNTLNVLNEKMKLGIDFTQWRQFHRPLHGLFPTHISASKTSFTFTTDDSKKETEVVEK